MSEYPIAAKVVNERMVSIWAEESGVKGYVWDHWKIGKGRLIEVKEFGSEEEAWEWYDQYK